MSKRFVVTTQWGDEAPRAYWGEFADTLDPTEFDMRSVAHRQLDFLLDEAGWAGGSKNELKRYLELMEATNAQ